MPFLFCALITSCASRTSRQSAPLSRTGFFFNTIIEIRIYDADADAALLDGCMEICNRYEQLFSAHLEGTDIARINAGEGEAVTVDAECAYLISQALRYTEVTDGAFDLTIGAVSDLWNFTGDPPGPKPDADVLAEALSHVGASNVTIRLADAVPLTAGGEDDDAPEIPVSGPAGSDVSDVQQDLPPAPAAHTASVTLADPEARIDPGAVAKGYVADRLKAYLKANGVRSALINLGGNVLAIGSKPDGSDFSVGIQDPVSASSRYNLVADVSDRSVVTSGNYERFFEEDGVCYHHILDARTGYPADTGLSSVTVITDDSFSGDILSTVLFLMGAEKGFDYAESLPLTEALFITTDGDILMTSAFPLK